MLCAERKTKRPNTVHKGLIQWQQYLIGYCGDTFGIFTKSTNSNGNFRTRSTSNFTLCACRKRYFIDVLLRKTLPYLKIKTLYKYYFKAVCT